MKYWVNSNKMNGTIKLSPYINDFYSIFSCIRSIIDNVFCGTLLLFEKNKFQTEMDNITNRRHKAYHNDV